MTESDDSLDAMLVNSESWSETSDEPNEHKGKVMLLQAWAPPRESDAHIRKMKDTEQNS